MKLMRNLEGIPD